ncbi:MULTISPECIES: DUF4249 domain-containing protein [unclassified Spirosoma]|uniref:DUF4249 domain-containing protein n=1 Tax=unclassified Spirosoma TaxID=2621999 RepID=UPI000965E77B|nr:MULTISPECIES: DUF4249 domain-containing protein [unclassified Spirosoma]MBN8826045.1 DUF4249 domain-containing protein [Spirosoma sp.]OJW75499.1 MAG: hypothetical protein BGO59_08125 [Spirosoma sp. 48-14]
MRNLLLAGVFILLIACVDEVQLPIRQVEPRLVVDGFITDEAPPYPIKLTFSGTYSSGNLFPEELIINGAIVTITDNGERTVALEQDPLLPSYYWMRNPAFRGQPGHRYTLKIVLPDGRTYVSSPELLAPIAPIERVYAEYRQSDGYSGQPDLYNILIDTQDPATPGDYYRWSTYSYVPRWASYDPKHPPVGAMTLCSTCSCWVPYFSQLTSVLSDALINGNRISHRSVFNSPVYAVGRQYVEVRQYSLSRAAYQHWTHFDEQRSRTGSLFDPQPASIEGNVHLQADTTVLALGYFGASAVSKQRLVIPGDTINYDKFLNRLNKSFIPPGDCGSNFPQFQLDVPVGW